MTLVILFLVLLCCVQSGFFYVERKNYSRERENLLQRIQAPEVAVVSHATGETPRAVNPVPALDDEEIWDVINGGDR